MKRGQRHDTFTLKHVQSSLGLSRTVITGLIDAGFVAPQRGARNEYRFSFQDLMLLRTAHELRDARVAPRDIVQALNSLRVVMPAGSPLTGVRITGLGAQAVVRDPSGRPRELATGQFVFDFDAPARPADVAPRAAAALRLPRATPDRGRAEQPAPPEPLPTIEQAFADAASIEHSDPDAALTRYRQVLAVQPKHVNATLNLSALLIERDRSDEARALCSALIGRGVDHPLLRFNLAIALENLGEPRRALAAYRRAIELDPAFADAHYNAACLLEKLNDSRAALRHFNAYRRLQRG